MEAAGLGIAVFQITGEALQLSIRLKQLWDEIQNVPEEIRALLDDIHGISTHLESIESQINNPAPPQAWDPCNLQGILRRSCRAKESLSEVVDELQAELGSSRGKTGQKIAAIKVLLKKKTLERLQEKLKRSLDLLRWSTELHTLSLVTHISSVISNSMRQPMHSRIELIEADYGPPKEHLQGRDGSVAAYPATAPIASPRQLRQMLGHRQSSWLGRVSFGFVSDGSSLSFQAPSWMANAIYSVMVQRSLVGWQLHVRCYDTIRRWDRSIWHALSKDKFDVVQKALVLNGVPSIFSRTALGETLIDLAIARGATSTVRELLKLGLDAFVDDKKLYDWFSTIRGCCEMFNTTRFIETLGPVLTSRSEDAEEGCLEMMALATQTLHAAGLQRFQQLYVPRYQAFPLSDKLRLARAAAESLDFSSDVLSVVLPQIGAIDLRLAQGSRENSCSIVHTLAEGLARSVANSYGLEQQEYWDWIVCCMVKDPSSRSWIEGQESPWYRHIRVLYSDLVLLAPEDFQYHVSSWHCWIKALQKAGTRLNVYGKREMRLSRSCQWRQLEVEVKKGKVTESKKRVRLLGFTYGPELEDWVLWWVMEYEHFAGEFWRMVENSPTALPGSWVYDDGSCNRGYQLEDEEEEEGTLIWSCAK